MMKLIQLTALLLSVFLVFQCTPLKNSASTNTEKSGFSMIVSGCTAVARVKNFTHEAGCQYLFMLEDGTMLLPGEMPETKTPFFEGAGVKIGYEVLDKGDNVVSKTSCQSHDHIVKITCIEEYVIREDGSPIAHADCKSIKNPHKFNWMREAIAKNQPKRVREYEYDIGFLYEFETGSGMQLYDCLGNLMCSSQEGPDCQSLVETLSKPKVILVSNN